MSKEQLHDYASTTSTKGMHEKTPVHFLKREGISLEGEAARKHAGDLKYFEEAEYISGSRSNPHEEPKSVGHSYYYEHGFGKGKPTGAQKESGQKVSTPSTDH